MIRNALLLLTLSLSLAGCRPPANDIPPSLVTRPTTTLGANFRPTECGTIAGQVTWQGTIPETGRAIATVPNGDAYRWFEIPMPQALAISPETRGLANVLIELEGVNPSRSRTWDHPPVRVLMKDFRYSLPNGAIARRGDAVEFVSEDRELHVVRGRGADFFGWTFANPSSRSRTFHQPGIVDLTSGAGYFWCRAEVVVRDDPYATFTDVNGRFTLPQVPEGSYTLRLRVLNPNLDKIERDPETGLPFRYLYHAPHERRLAVMVKPSGTAEIQETISNSSFATKPENAEAK
ncbi:MAG: carboxypeptidase regulatory-like domain-containing protein [Fimbriiglobus sp.]